MEETRGAEERVMRVLHVGGVNLGVFVMAGASALTFMLALARLVGAVVYTLGLAAGPAAPVLESVGVRDQPVVLMLVNVVDAAILAVIFLTFAFGLKTVFLGKRYAIVAFDIRDIDELKAYLIGLVITLLATRFLEFILGRQASASEILGAGLGSAAMVLSLAAYTVVLRRWGSGPSVIEARESRRAGEDGAGQA